MSDAFVMAVSNRKGGTGKTTSTVNLAAELVVRGFKILLIDLDTQGHAGLGIGAPDATKGGPTAHRIFMGENHTLREAIVDLSPHLSVIVADPLFDGTDARRNDITILAQHLRNEGLLEEYDVILMDTPPSLDLLLLNALAAANGVLVPLSAHPLGLHGVQQLIRLFYRVGATVNESLRLVGLLPVMLDRRIRLHVSILEEAERQFGASRLLGGIRSDIRLAEAFAVRKPIRAYAPRSRGALDYHLLAEEVIGNWLSKKETR